MRTSPYRQWLSKLSSRLQTGCTTQLRRQRRVSRSPMVAMSTTGRGEDTRRQQHAEYNAVRQRKLVIH
ncbi:hypothetical protein DPMN_165208 [Dreissena polymorpha]|uniref:Uncharacterized protein n=1 Tax=Dreissena polymorpha TaxID=45954 RepID=A0A9D4EUD1_DREPO|nr:hypothetical protein DPMN_165208 [Dreissena polymorpha]